MIILWDEINLVREFGPKRPTRYLAEKKLIKGGRFRIALTSRRFAFSSARRVWIRRVQQALKGAASFVNQ
jgi:hypothetical protein